MASPSSSFVRPGQNFDLTFSPVNVIDDDGEIDVLDLYLLDLSTHNLSIVDWVGAGWTHEYLATYNDDHFSLPEAVNQTLTVTLNLYPTAPEGQQNIVCYFQFSDFDGVTTGLGDNIPLLPLDDAINHYCFYVTADNTPPEITYVHIEGYDLAGPISLFDGVSVEAGIFDQFPLGSVTFHYGADSPPNNSVPMSGDLSGGVERPFTANIPVVDIVENQAIFYYVSAIDKAGNTASTPTTSFIPYDNPEFISYGPDTTLPDTAVNFNANVIDFSGVESVTFAYSINGLEQPSISLASAGGDDWTALLGSFSEGDLIEYTLTAADPFDHLSNVTGSFRVLYRCDTSFNIQDFITREFLNGVTLDIAAFHVTGPGDGIDYWIPAEQHAFDQTIALTQYEGSYTYTFKVDGYNDKVISRTLDGGPECSLSEDIFMGQPIDLTIAEVNFEEAPLCTQDETQLFVHITSFISSTYDLAQTTFFYSFDVEDYSQSFELIEQEPGIFVGSLGPLTGETTLFSKVYVEDISGASATEFVGGRWYYLVPCAVDVPDVCMQAEVCNNYVDDDCDGSTDEGCGCDFGAQKICGKSVGACQSGFQFCQEDGTWTDCQNEIVSVSEVCGNQMDDDCDGSIDEGCEDEYGEACLYGELLISLKENVSLGNRQKLVVLHPDKGPLANALVSITFPDEAVFGFSTDEEGEISFIVTQPGNYKVVAFKNNLQRTEHFDSFDLLAATRKGLEDSASIIRPSTGIADQPKIIWFLWMMLLTILSVIAGLLAFDHLISLIKGGRVR
jgi:hypothetical protein